VNRCNNADETTGKQVKHSANDMSDINKTTLKVTDNDSAARCCQTISGNVYLVENSQQDEEDTGGLLPSTGTSLLFYTHFVPRATGATEHQLSF
jgi:hypothetical protein